MSRLLTYLLSVCCVFSLPSCTEVDCPLDSVVVMTCGLYDATSESHLTLPHALSVTPYGKDTLLLNSASQIGTFVLPLKMASTCDTVLLHFSDDWDQSAVDTLILYHENMPHFESVECPTTIFHHLNRVEWINDTRADLDLKIDSVAIVRELVDYNDVENIQIYLHSAP